MKTVLFDWDGTLLRFPALRLLRLLLRIVKLQTWYSRSVFLAKKTELVAGASDTLSLLSGAGYRLGIVSGRDRMSLERQLQMFGIACGLFDFVQTSSDTIFRKPDPRVFISARALYGNEIIYVGDTVDDYRAARGIGFEFVAVLTGLATRKQFLRAGVPAENIIDSVANLPDFLGVAEEDADAPWAEAYK